MMQKTIAGLTKISIDITVVINCYREHRHIQTENTMMQKYILSALCKKKVAQLASVTRGVFYHACKGKGTSLEKESLSCHIFTPKRQQRQ